MPFVMPDVVIESVLRDGIANARRDEAVIEDVFANLTRSFATEKYGLAEIERIKNVIRKKEISFVHSFADVAPNMPCVSIQLADDVEDEEHSHLGDWEDNVDVPFTDEDDIAGLVVVEAFTPSAYDPLTGKITIPDAVSLSAVHVNLLFVDAAGNENVIVGGIINTTGSKQVMVAVGSTISLAGTAEIKSALNFKRYEMRGNHEKEQIILGVHTGDALLTKYIYTLMKYFLVSRKADIHSRDLDLTTYRGSDFHRNLDYGADRVFTRFINITATCQNTWRSDQVVLVDNFSVTTLVDQDEATNETLGLEDQTVQQTD